MLKIKTFGYRAGPRPSAIEMIEKEFIKLGHQIVDKDADLIFEMCGLYENAQKFWKEDGKKGVRIYSLLDVNNPDPSFYDWAALDYEECEVACTISNTVKAEIKEKFQTNREINVIGFPIREVSLLKMPRGIQLFVGRFNDPNKRTHLIKPCLEKLGIDPTNLVVVGSEKPPFGCFHEENVDDERLNLIYNAAEFVFLPSKKEGIGLPAVESVKTGAIPLLANDNKVLPELGLTDFSCEPNPEAMVALIRKIQKNVQFYWDKMDNLRHEFEQKYSAKTVAKNILDLYYGYIRNK